MATRSESSLAALERDNPTAYRLLYVMKSWADFIAARPTAENNRLMRMVPMIVPHMAQDLAQVPEEGLRLGLEQIKGAIDAILTGADAPAPPGADDAGGADAKAG